MLWGFNLSACIACIVSYIKKRDGRILHAAEPPSLVTMETEIALRISFFNPGMKGQTSCQFHSTCFCVAGNHIISALHAYGIWRPCQDDENSCQGFTRFNLFGFDVSIFSAMTLTVAEITYFSSVIRKQIYILFFCNQKTNWGISTKCLLDVPVCVLIDITTSENFCFFTCFSCGDIQRMFPTIKLLQIQTINNYGDRYLSSVYDLEPVAIVGWIELGSFVWRGFVIWCQLALSAVSKLKGNSQCEFTFREKHPY